MQMSLVQRSLFSTSRKISFTTLTHKNKRVKSRLPRVFDSFRGPFKQQNLFVASVFPQKETCFAKRQFPWFSNLSHGVESGLAGGIGHRSVSSTLSTAARVADHTRSHCFSLTGVHHNKDLVEWEKSGP